MTIVVRTYESEQPARDAAKVLEEEKLCLGEIVVVSPPSPAAPAPAAPAPTPPAATPGEPLAGTGPVGAPQAPASPPVAASADREQGLELITRGLILGNMLGDDADVYAEALGRGEFLLIVEPFFGRAGRVTEIMERYGPTDVGVRPVEPFVPFWQLPAPLSKILFLPVLLRDEPAPLSDYVLSVRTLKRRRRIMPGDYPELTDPDFSLSGRLDWPLLSSKPAPLSSAIGLPTRSGRPAPWTSSFGMSLLSDNPAPLSSALKIPLLTSNPAPLSSALGLETLSKRTD